MKVERHITVPEDALRRELLGLIEQRNTALKLLDECRPYIAVEAGLSNSGYGTVIGTPAKRLLARIDEALRQPETRIE